MCRDSYSNVAIQGCRIVKKQLGNTASQHSILVSIRFKMVNLVADFGGGAEQVACLPMEPMIPRSIQKEGGVALE